MITDINPFFLRASEYVDLDDQFLTLFSPDVLGMFKQDGNIWGNVKILRSAPGGGKTTLLRMFTPKILRKLKETSKHDDHNREIYNELKQLGVFTSDGNICVIGSIVQFNNEYVAIQYQDISDTQKLRVFQALVNVRIVLSILHSIYLIWGFGSVDDYKRISFNFSGVKLLPSSLRSISDGLKLYSWACDYEEMICREIDDVLAAKDIGIDLAGDLYSLDIFNPSNFLIDGEIVTERVLVMLDDVHNLSSFQRGHLVKTIITKRPQVNVWISERLKALTMDELFSDEGNTEGRDMSTIHLEKYWSTRYTAFEKFVKSVANRRITQALGNAREFASFLLEDYQETDMSKIRAATLVVKERVISTYGRSEKYKVWIEAATRRHSTDYDELIEWRSLEILCYRDNNRSQKTLNFGDFFLSEEELREQQGSDVSTAAQLFVHREFQIPFYFGITRISRLASFNIEQFLSISGELFEEIKYNDIKRVVNDNFKLELAPSRQESVIKNLVNKVKWKELNNKVPNFTKLGAFLDSLGRFCQQETYVPNAWNSPGLNGIAIFMRDRDFLKNEVLIDKRHPYYELAKCLADCISYNLLDFELNYKSKGRLVMILYLNKIYCTKYSLPLNRGGFKEKRLNELLNWYNNGFKPSVQSKLTL